MEDNFLEQITILIVDDSKVDREILETTLTRYFKRVYTAGNGHDAYEIYQNNKDIDIIISDIEMPKMSGLELLRLIRLSDLYLPVIIVSGRFETEFLIEALNLNVSSFLPKPVNVKLLLEKVDILCEKKLYEMKAKEKQVDIDHYLASVDKVAIIYKMKANGDITYMNDSMCNVSGYSKKESKSLNFNQIIHPDIPQKYIDETWKLLKEGNLFKGNTKFIDKNKEPFYLHNTMFKLESNDDEYITIAFLTTQEHLQKRDFHKKVIQSVKEFNLKEYDYKQEIQALKTRLESVDTLEQEYKIQIKNLKSKVKGQELQLKEHEKQLQQSSLKYENMLKTKKSELERYVNLIQTEKIQNERFEKESTTAKSELEALRFDNAKLKEENEDMYHHIKDLKALIQHEREKRKETKK